LQTRDAMSYNSLSTAGSYANALLAAINTAVVESSNLIKSSWTEERRRVVGAPHWLGTCSLTLRRASVCAVEYSAARYRELLGDERTAARHLRRLLEGAREGEHVGVAVAPPDDL
jgi:hypothetical protein